MSLRSRIGLSRSENQYQLHRSPGQPLEQLRTNSSGQTETIELAAPPVEYSLQPSEEQPYSEYNLKVEAEGYEPIEVSGSEILSGEISRQKIALRPISDGNYEDVVIPDHTLFGNYPEKIPEEEIKPVNESGEIVLSRVVIPEYVVVHDGSPADSTADNYYVRYRDYIKTWHAARYTQPGRLRRSRRMFWQSCLLP